MNEAPWITRVAAVSAAGWGVEALLDALDAQKPLARPVPWDAPGLRSPFAALARAGGAEELLGSVVEAVVPVGGAGLVVATSSGAISGDFEAWHRAHRAAPASEGAGARSAPTRAVAARFGLAPAVTLSVACTSGTAAFEVARGWLRAGVCERVIVVGYDALSLYIHAGFGGLGALAAERSRPFQAGRDGLMLGEGAAAFLLEHPASARAAGREPLVALRGCGLSQDGVHLTAPDRTGAGLGRAARAAIADAGVDPAEIGAVSAHATGTPFNDAMEARALAALFGGPVPLHCAKPVIGHTLGAAGALEAAALVGFLAGGDAPPPPEVTDPDCPVEPAPARRTGWGLSVNAAFGGVNSAVVFGPPGPEISPVREVHAVARSEIATDELAFARIFPGAPPALGRADAYVRGGIALLAGLRERLTADTAVVLASEGNCHAADRRYHAGLLDGGPPGASRVHFSYTIPGAPAAEAAILLGLRGPTLTFCDAPERAHLEARRLVAQGVAPRAVAVVLEAPAAFATGDATLYEAGD